MYGAIIGDIVGSIYEYDEFNNSEKGIINLEKRLEILSKKDLIEEKCFFSDDTDTIACIVGGMAEALYGVPQYLIEIVKTKLPKEFNQLLEKGYKRIK